jgi:hypothetical protein
MAGNFNDDAEQAVVRSRQTTAIKTQHHGPLLSCRAVGMRPFIHPGASRAHLASRFIATNRRLVPFARNLNQLVSDARPRLCQGSTCFSPPVRLLANASLQKHVQTDLASLPLSVVR